MKWVGGFSQNGPSGSAENSRTAHTAPSGGLLSAGVPSVTARTLPQPLYDKQPSTVDRSELVGVSFHATRALPFTYSFRPGENPHSSYALMRWRASVPFR